MTYFQHDEAVASSSTTIPDPCTNAETASSSWLRLMSFTTLWHWH